MIQQRAQVVQGRPVRESLLDSVETRTVKASNQIGVGRHEPMVAPAEAETEGNEPVFSTETDGNSDTRSLTSSDLAAEISLALDRAGITHKLAAIQQGLTPGQWSKQLSGTDGHHVSLLRLRRLPRSFWREFLAILAGDYGMQMQHPDADAAALGDLLQAAGRIMGRFQVRSQLPASVCFDRRRG